MLPDGDGGRAPHSTPTWVPGSGRFGPLNGWGLSRIQAAKAWHPWEIHLLSLARPCTWALSARTVFLLHAGALRGLPTQ